jgi:hypothetical protein
MINLRRDGQRRTRGAAVRRDDVFAGGFAFDARFRVAAA